jgi:hypothetical protein
MRSRSVATSGLGALLFCANCSKLDDFDAARDFADVAVDASRITTRVLGDPLIGREGLPGTNFDYVPRSGAAVFHGTAIVAGINDDDVDAGFALVGRSKVTVDFGPGTNNITGTLSQFQSSREGEGILNVSGQLQLQNGIVGADSPNRFAVDYVGTVTVEGTNYMMSGDMLGQFRGTRTNPGAGQSTVRALTAVDLNGVVHGGDQQLDGRMTVIAEN